MNHGIDCRESLCGSVLEEARDELNGIRISLAENLVEWVWLDLREFVLHVIWVHGADLISSWSSQDLDDFYQLINSRLPRKQWLAQHQFRHNTAS